ncbi:hypothetical protein ABEB36_004863 [Hypothenemus hampei]|uniref:F-box/LRR-repeat protein 15-like leucin rich repeat domain-containing protein n=1 Tax=Hypothenemus hampei TaxID=57062 RepID=A0ABD1EW58_HYPHA
MDFQSKISTVDSLLNLVTNYIVKNIDQYENHDLAILPVKIKSRLLKKFLATLRYKLNHNWIQVFRTLSHKDITKIDFRDVDVCDCVLDILSTCPNLRELHIKDKQERISSKGLSNLLLKTKLQILEISYSDAVNDEVLKCLCKNPCYLKILDIKGSSISDEGLKYLSVLKLHSLRMSKTKITDEGLRNLIQGPCSQTLTEFIINNCPQVTYVAVQKVIDNCPKLSNLQVMNCPLAPLAALVFPKPIKQLFWNIL